MKALVRRGYRRLLEVRGNFEPARHLDRPGDAVAILMYHGIEDSARKRTLCPQDVSGTACIDEIRFFQRQGYRVAAPGDWSDEDGGGSPKLVVTFDDGNRNALPLLRRLTVNERIPILVAVCPLVIETGGPFWYEEVAARVALSDLWRDRGPSDARGRRLTSGRYLHERYFTPRRTIGEVLDEIRALTEDVSPEQVAGSGHVHSNLAWDELRTLVATGYCTVAAHSMAHEAATHMTVEDFARDAGQCREIIEAALGVECLDYVYPFGSEQVYSEHTEAVLRRLGYRRSYTTVHRMNGIHERMALGRFTGTGLNVAPRYYEYLWRRRHETFSGTSVAPL